MKTRDIFFNLLFVTQTLSAAIGCMEQSATRQGQKVRQRFDYKDWHFVQCNCQCQKYHILTNGQCWNCLHAATHRMSNATTDLSTVMKQFKMNFPR